MKGGLGRRLRSAPSGKDDDAGRITAPTALRSARDRNWWTIRRVHARDIGDVDDHYRAIRLLRAYTDRGTSSAHRGGGRVMCQHSAPRSRRAPYLRTSARPFGSGSQTRTARAMPRPVFFTMKRNSNCFGARTTLRLDVFTITSRPGGNGSRAFVTVQVTTPSGAEGLVTKYGPPRVAPQILGAPCRS